LSGIAQGCYRGSGFSGGVAGVSELSVGISAPAFNASGGKYGTTVLITAVDISRSTDSGNGDWYATVHKSIISELSVAAVTPAFDCSAGKSGAGMAGTCRNLNRSTDS